MQTDSRCIAMSIATRSPGAKPAARSAFITSTHLARSSPRERRRTAPPGSAYTTASISGSRFAKQLSAMLSRAPGSHALAGASSTRVGGVSKWIPSFSSTSGQKSVGWSYETRCSSGQSAAGSPVHPRSHSGHASPSALRWREKSRMKRARLVSAHASAVGVHSGAGPSVATSHTAASKTKPATHWWSAKGCLKGWSTRFEISRHSACGPCSPRSIASRSAS